MSASSKFYEIENLNKPWGFVRQQGLGVCCPLDGKPGAAYVHCIRGEDNVGIATHMLSWTWSYTARDVVGTLDSFCQENELDQRRVYVWMCCLCLNQHRVFESNKSGISSTCSTLDFENEFQRRVVGIGRILVMVRPWGDPENLKRIWCIFEVFMGLVVENCEIAFVMPRMERDRMLVQLFSSFGSAGKRGIDMFYTALSQVDLEKAESSVATDRERILDLIRERIGFTEVNLLVRNKLRLWIRSVIDEVVQERAQLERPGATSDSMVRAGKLSYATFLDQVADIYYLYGDNVEAEKMYRKALTVRSSVGSGDLDLSESYTDIGKTLFARGLFVQSIDMYLEALRIRRSKLAEDHLETAATYFHIGRLLHEIEDFDKALTMMSRCLAIQEMKLGLSHRDTAVTYAYIGLLLGETTSGGFCEDGMEVTRKALHIIQHSIGNDNHPDVAFCYFVMGRLLEDYDIDEASAMMTLCCRIQEKVLGSQHPSLAATFSRLGELLQRQGRLRDAVSRFRQALDVLRATHTRLHVSVIRTCANLCVCATLMKDEKGAKKWHDKVITTLQLCPSEHDSKLLRIYSRAGVTCCKSGDRGTAAKLLRRGLDVKEVMLGNDDPSLADGHEAVDQILMTAGIDDNECIEKDDTALLDQYHRALSLRPETKRRTDGLEGVDETTLEARTTTQWLENRRNSVP